MQVGEVQPDRERDGGGVVKPMMRRAATVTGVSVLVLLLAAASAFAYWKTTGSGTGSATAASTWTEDTGTVAPTVSVTFPAASTNYNSTGAFNNQCSGNDGICGTATAGSGSLAAGSTTVTIRRTVSSTVTYWSGSAWSASSTTLATTGTTSWRYGITFANVRAGLSNGTSATYLVSATVTNTAGTNSATRTFTTS